VQRVAGVGIVIQTGTALTVVVNAAFQLANLVPAFAWLDGWENIALEL